jgi:hypothetical protein
VAGRVDADTIRILKNSTHHAEAFTALTYLVTTGVDKLIIGSAEQAPAYGALSAITSKQAPWLAAKKNEFPFVADAGWDILMAGLNYPDAPSAEGFLPNQIESWDRIINFGGLLSNNSGLTLATEEATLESDLTTIFNKTFVTISGNAGAAGVSLNYNDGSDKTATSIYDGSYALTVSSEWSGTVTPSRTGYAFLPAFKTFTFVTADKTLQNFLALPQLYLPLIKR